MQQFPRNTKNNGNALILCECNDFNDFLIFMVLEISGVNGLLLNSAIFTITMLFAFFSISINFLIFDVCEVFVICMISANFVFWITFAFCLVRNDLLSFPKDIKITKVRKTAKFEHNMRITEI